MIDLETRLLGPYAGYIVPAYLAALIILGGSVLLSLMRYRRAQRDLAALEALRGGRRR